MGEELEKLVEREKILARIEARTVVDPETGCHVWQGSTTKGYGTLSVDNKTWRAHRLAYVLAHGAVPEGMVLDHLCRNRACCNPAHIEAVTNRENLLRGEGTLASWYWSTECKQGHPRTPENTYTTADGRRSCKLCEGTRKRGWYARAREAERNAIARAEAAEAQLERVERERDEADEALAGLNQEANFWATRSAEALSRAQAAEAQAEAMRKALESVADWIRRLPIPTTGATAQLMNIGDALASSTPESSVGAEWRPIETAPKDGTEVLIWNSEGHEIAHWIDREEDGPDQPGHDAGWLGTFAFPGRSWGLRLRSEPQGQARAWMPLPAAPAEARSDNG